jgi:hypothetical protein
MDLLQAYSDELPRLGIIGSAKILIDPAIVGTTFTQCKCRHGTTGRLIKNSVRMALMDGADTLLPLHLWKAVSTSKMLFPDEPTNYFDSYGATA